MTCGRRQYFLVRFVLAVVIFPLLIVDASLPSPFKLFVFLGPSQQSVFALPINSRRSLSSSFEVGLCRKGSSIFFCFFAGH